LIYLERRVPSDQSPSHIHTGCEEPYFHWNYGRSTLKGLPILIAYFPQYVGEYFVYTTSLFYFKYAYFILNTFQDIFQHIFAQTVLNELTVNIFPWNILGIPCPNIC
jgi:hypothetical protein